MKKLIIFNSIGADSHKFLLSVWYGKILHCSEKAPSHSMWEKSDRFASFIVDNVTGIDGKEVDTKKMILTGE